MKIFRFKLLDLKEGTLIFETPITDSLVIGRLKSGLYTFNDGHIYYNNNAIKIRYDLINQLNNQKYTENQIFDFYQNIFSLTEGIKVRSNTPLDSIRAHRFAYVTNDSNFNSPKWLFILPYLHDRKIYLNRAKLNIKYFYTSIKTTEKEEIDYMKYLDSTANKMVNDGKTEDKIIDLT